MTTSNSKRGIDFSGCHSQTVRVEMVSQSGIQQIRNVIQEYAYSQDWGYLYFNPAPNCDWRVSVPSTGQQGEWAGMIHKRIPKWLAHNGKPLSDTVKSAIANLVRQHTEAQEDRYYFRFRVGNRIDWGAGDFGHGGHSCWWGDYRAGFDEFREEGGAAICFYSSMEACKAHDIKEGIARAWLWRDGGAAYLFNSYGLPLLEIAGVLERHWGIPSKDCTVDCDSGALYINGSSHYGFGEARTSFDLPISSSERQRCEECGYELDEDDMYTSDSGGHYCETCYSERYERCSQCGEELSAEDCKHNPDGEALCDYHWERKCCECYACDSVVWLDDAQAGPDEELYCEGCHSDKFAECEECGEVSERGDGEDIGGDWLCEDCAPAWQECEECGERISSDSPDGLCGDCAVDRNMPQEETLADDSHFALALVAAQS